MRQDGNMEDLVEAIGQLAQVWCEEPLDEENSFSLMAPPENIVVRPPYPDRWMLFQGKSVKFPGRRDNVVLPSADKTCTEPQRDQGH